MASFEKKYTLMNVSDSLAGMGIVCDHNPPMAWLNLCSDSWNDNSYFEVHIGGMPGSMGTISPSDSMELIERLDNGWELSVPKIEWWYVDGGYVCGEATVYGFNKDSSPEERDRGFADVRIRERGGIPDDIMIRLHASLYDDGEPLETVQSEVVTISTRPTCANKDQLKKQEALVANPEPPKGEEPKSKSNQMNDGKLVIVSPMSYQPCVILLVLYCAAVGLATFFLASGQLFPGALMAGLGLFLALMVIIVWRRA